MLLQKAHELLRSHIHAQIRHFESLGFDHHAHEVLPDIVHVALHRADDSLADRL